MRNPSQIFKSLQPQGGDSWLCSRVWRNVRRYSLAEQQGIDQGIEKNTPRIRSAVSLNKRKSREKHNRILLEGWRLIHDALQAKVEPVTMFYSDVTLIDKLPSDIPSRLYSHVGHETMRTLSSAVTPPGIVGVFKKPRLADDSNNTSVRLGSSSGLPLTVICDQMRDPSNLGTLVRTCAAAGCKSIITSKGSADIWDPKVLRSAAGGHFRIPLHPSLSWDQIADQLDRNVKVFWADCDPTGYSSPPKAHFEVDWTSSPIALIVGGETSGISKEAKMLAHGGMGQAVHVPMVEGTDSLSASMAASLIVYEAYRQFYTKS